MERYAIVPHDGANWVVIYDSRYHAQVEDVNRFIIRHTKKLDGYPNNLIVRYGTKDWQRVFCTSGSISDRAMVSNG